MRRALYVAAAAVACGGRLGRAAAVGAACQDGAADAGQCSALAVAAGDGGPRGATAVEGFVERPGRVADEDVLVVERPLGPDEALARCRALPDCRAVSVRGDGEEQASVRLGSASRVVEED
mmetsp:Transcript_16852/g.58821  ORF Transcript_16852/g.58821 Transcript_16852/m.58821 type:complete len:121 (+) Transcript_16852:245-607(+)